MASGGGGALRGAKILQTIMAPLLSVIKIVKYCGVMGGGGGIGGRQNPTKGNAAPSVIKIVKYCGVRGRGGGIGGGAPKSYKNNSVPHFCH